jgi:hypothetical protein
VVKNENGRVSHSCVTVTRILVFKASVSSSKKTDHSNTQFIGDIIKLNKTHCTKCSIVIDCFSILSTTMNYAFRFPFIIFVVGTDSFLMTV